MANLAPDPNDSLPQPATDSGATNSRPMSAAQHKHFKDLVGHTLDNATAVGHGHFVGSQGEKGHKMVPSDANFQKGTYIPQGSGQNRQNTSSDGAGSANANPPGSDDYAKVWTNPND
jgi:hypothetical protein